MSTEIGRVGTTMMSRLDDDDVRPSQAGQGKKKNNKMLPCCRRRTCALPSLRGGAAVLISQIPLASLVAAGHRATCWPGFPARCNPSKASMSSISKNTKAMNGVRGDAKTAESAGIKLEDISASSLPNARRRERSAHRETQTAPRRTRSFAVGGTEPRRQRNTTAPRIVAVTSRRTRSSCHKVGEHTHVSSSEDSGKVVVSDMKACVSARPVCGLLESGRGGPVWRHGRGRR